MVKGDRQAWKAAYFEKAERLLTQYERVSLSITINYIIYIVYSTYAIVLTL